MTTVSSHSVHCVTSKVTRWRLLSNSSTAISSNAGAPKFIGIITERHTDNSTPAQLILNLQSTFAAPLTPLLF